jgi:hypothetical protein
MPLGRGHVSVRGYLMAGAALQTQMGITAEADFSPTEKQVVQAVAEIRSLLTSLLHIE